MDLSRSSKSISFRILILLLLFISGCQTTDFPKTNSPFSIGFDVIRTRYGNYSKCDTLYLDTTDTKNKIHSNGQLFFSLNTNTTLTFGGIATFLGSNTGELVGLKTSLNYTLSIVGNSLDSIYLDYSVFTITGVTVSGFLKDTVVNLFPIVTTLPSSLPKVNASNTTISGPSGLPTAVEVVYRDQGNPNAITVGSLTANAFTEVPSNFLSILTLGNKDLKSTLASDKAKGWRVVEVNNISFNGGTRDITDGVTLSIREGVSGILTYYPDGFFTFISAIDNTYNQFGWYRISMLNGQPVGIVYQVVNSGSTFSDSPVFPNPVQGYGIWGLANNSFYPIIRLDKFRQAVLTCTPYEY